ncbi:hypothetical protein DV515_00000211 [Chloebia gouldiae]|uniref:Uncharacterized protein n=1 Tax=Chloebia gouldiae TaxID=44316 RepID=A0A3L8T0E0_CHLGU|nr:hypothetical protein DV515_00000211 [Chloebia gouldiae]
MTITHAGSAVPGYALLQTAAKNSTNEECVMAMAKTEPTMSYPLKFLIALGQHQLGRFIRDDALLLLSICMGVSEIPSKVQWLQEDKNLALSKKPTPFFLKSKNNKHDALLCILGPSAISRCWPSLKLKHPSLLISVHPLACRSRAPGMKVKRDNAVPFIHTDPRWLRRLGLSASSHHGTTSSHTCQSVLNGSPKGTCSPGTAGVLWRR